MRRLAFFFVSLAYVTPTLNATTLDPMAQLCVRFLGSLDSAQREEAVLPFDHPGRTQWGYVPLFYRRHLGNWGIRMWTLTDEQQDLALGLVGNFLSPLGLKTLQGIRDQDPAFKRLVGGWYNGDPVGVELPATGIYHPGQYALSVFGDPRSERNWSWQFTGHHFFAQQTSSVDRAISKAPFFIGSLPTHAEPRSFGDGLQQLAEEERLGLSFFQNFRAKDKAIMRRNLEAPADLIYGPQYNLGPEFWKANQRTGLRLSDAREEDRARFLALVNAYVRHLNPIYQVEKLRQIGNAGWDQIFVEWSGGDRLGEPHHFLVRGPDFLIECANVWDGNHIHFVWHDRIN